MQQNVKNAPEGILIKAFDPIGLVAFTWPKKYENKVP